MIKGTQNLISRFKALSNELQEDIKDAVEETTLAVERQAITNAPSAGDRLALNSTNLSRKRQNSQINNTAINQFIHSLFENDGYKGQVYIDSLATPLPVYVELGTGSSAANYVPTLSPEWQAVARRYYINGRGTLVKQPYLLPAYYQEAPKLTKRIVEILKKAKL